MEDQRAQLDNLIYEYPITILTTQSKFPTVFYCRTPKERELWVLIICRAMDISQGAIPPYLTNTTYDDAVQRHKDIG
jgi:hypothetical protein